MMVRAAVLVKALGWNFMKFIYILSVRLFGGWLGYVSVAPCFLFLFLSYGRYFFLFIWPHFKNSKWCKIYKFHALNENRSDPLLVVQQTIFLRQYFVAGRGRSHGKPGILDMAWIWTKY